MAKKSIKREKQTAEGKSHTKKKAARFSVFTALSLVALFLLILGIYSISHTNKVYANVYLGDTDLSGKSKQEVSEYLKNSSEEFLKQKFTLIHIQDGSEDKTYEIIPNDIGLVYDTESTASSIYGYGRNGSIWRDFAEQFMSLLKPRYISAKYTINEEALNTKIADIAGELDIPEKDYAISYAGDGKFELLTEKQTGKRIDQPALINNVKFQISNVKMIQYRFSSNTYDPKVSEENAKNKLRAANQILKAGELTLNYAEFSAALDADTIGGLIKSRPKDDDLELYLDNIKGAKQIEAVAANINRAPQNAVLAASGGVVSAFQLSREGRELDQKQAIIDIGNALLARATEGVSDVDTKSVALKVKVTQPEISSASLEQYGLRELVATGTTDFRKSPSNRVHNITIGANAISGTLIKPGEEFSTLSRLGKIDASTGYLPELVIKNNKTLPDYGGGLCQVSTTLFRTAMNAGMKITSRRNHSYRVSYYEPPVGMDATIFDPAPDFKFVNNYASHILVQAKIVGTKITFEFYGTKDSRVVSIGTPDVYDYVEPPAPVETVDLALPPGTRNLISHSHQGASAKFHYEVVREGETLQKTDFTSKYAAIPEQWAVGPTAEPVPAPESPPLEAPA